MHDVLDSLVASEPPGPLIEPVAEWLMARAQKGDRLDELFEAACERLLATGIPLCRVHLTFTTLHPLYQAQALTWKRGSMLRASAYSHTDGHSDAWLRSPLHHLVEHQLPFLRRRLTGDDALLDFPILEEFQAAGATDYLGFIAAFGPMDSTVGQKEGVAGSWLTDRDDGFSNSHLSELLRIQSGIATAFWTVIQRQIAHNVVTTYLGREAGEKVLSGQIKRGDGERIRAVIWYSDMRRSTELADSLGDEAFLDALNRYFDCTAGAVKFAGGELLRFVGDAVLAIFPVASYGGEQAACAAAAAAVREAEERLQAANREAIASGTVTLDFGVGLHLGELLFGNIGIEERLEFTVVGPAANEVARIEDLTKTLGRRALASESVASHLPPADWEPMGEHPLRGVSGSRHLFAARSGHR